MLDGVLADELAAAIGVVELVDPHDATWERNAKPVGLGILDLEIHPHRLAGVDAVGLVALELAEQPRVLETVVCVDLLDGHGRDVDELDLLRLVVLERGAPAQGVEVILEECLLLEASLLGVLVAEEVLTQAVAAVGGQCHRHEASDVAGAQLEARVGEAGAAHVGDGDPAGEIDARVVGVDERRVVAAPGQAACLVRQDDGPLARALRSDAPRERRAGHQVIGQLGETERPRAGPHVVVVEQSLGQVADHLDAAVAGLEDQWWAAGEQGAAVASLVGVDELDGPADESLKHALLVGEVVVEALLEDAGSRGVGLVHEACRGGVDEGSDVGEAVLRGALGEVELAAFPHDAQPGVAGLGFEQLVALDGLPLVPAGRQMPGELAVGRVDGQDHVPRAHRRWPACHGGRRHGKSQEHGCQDDPHGRPPTTGAGLEARAILHDGRRRVCKWFVTAARLAEEATRSGSPRAGRRCGGGWR